jgi:4-amino-4-deoxy-L-arabinose transferase-like glycosyltransferase
MESFVQRWTSARRGPLLAALVVLIAALPGVFAMPTLDRDEARFAQATAQMIETRDPVSINFQDKARSKKPVGIHWLQSISVMALSKVESRDIWAYRIPSLLGAMLAAAACAWGAIAFFGPRTGTFAGVLMGATLLLSTEAFIAKTDAVLCGCITLMMAALGRIYGAARGEAIVAKVGTKALFWAGLAASMLVKGPIGPMVAGLALLALWLSDREGEPWIRKLGWTWGLALILLVVGPWVLAITVTTDGRFWSDAVMGDMISKLGSKGQESHGAPPGLHAMLAPLLTFPATLLLPAALVAGWKFRAEPGVRFALCWLLPAWVVFEISPTKLPHYTLPLYGALAWLMALAFVRGVGRVSRIVGLVLSAVVAVALAGGGVYLAARFGVGLAMAWALLAALLLAAAAVAGSVLAMQRRDGAAIAAVGTAGVLAHAVLVGGAAPALDPLWVSERAAAELDQADIDPRNGVTPGPVAVAGFEEPSLVFVLGTRTQLTDAAGAALAISEGRPAIVESRQVAAFKKALVEDETSAKLVEHVAGLNYSKGKPVDLFLYRSLEPMPGDTH